MLWCGSQARGLLRPFLLPVQRDPLGSQALTPGGTSPAAFHQEAAPASRRSPWEPGVLWTWLVLPQNKARQAPALTFHEDPSIKANFPKDGDLGTWPAPRRASRLSQRSAHRIQQQPLLSAQGPTQSEQKVLLEGKPNYERARWGLPVYTGASQPHKSTQRMRHTRLPLRNVSDLKSPFRCVDHGTGEPQVVWTTAPGSLWWQPRDAQLRAVTRFLRQELVPTTRPSFLAPSSQPTAPGRQQCCRWRAEHQDTASLPQLPTSSQECKGRSPFT